MNIFKTIGVITVLVIIVAIVVGINNILFRGLLNPSEIVIEDIQVTKEVIIIKGSILSSSKVYKSHQIRYVEVDGELYLQIRGGLIIKGDSDRRVADIDIKINNKYEGINKIYLGNDSSQEKRLVWQRKN